ncbi:MAG TPA: 3-oxoadipate enol-lactonase [Gaiellaceae bacterium]|nr:3-oxoadipate enol-lactonase [Gaiellaceae bacterium]
MLPFHRFDGPEDAPVLLLSNSLGTTHAMWEPQLPAFAEHFRVLRYDRRGHGRSAVPPGPYSIPELAADVTELLDSLELERVSYCGLSIGGMDAMWNAVNAPERIDRLALCSTSPWMPPRELWDERAALVRAEGTAAVAHATMERWFSPEFRAAEPETVARVRAMVAETPAEGYAACCEAIREWDFREELGRISAPTLVLSAEDDPSTPPDHGRLIADGIPGAGFSVLPGAWHLANVEQPEAFTEAVLEHLTAA